MTTTTKNQKHIAIIGGGPGGLTLALILQQHGIPTVIYEREIADKSHERGVLLTYMRTPGSKR